jgi:hypothetical protein
VRYRLERVRFIPEELEPGVLYVAEEFGAAAHLCASGCGEKIRTPLGPTEWSLDVTPDGLPSLSPSIGDWQKACQSHYWIERGEVIWSRKWTPKEIAAGRLQEERRRLAYYQALYRRVSVPRRIWRFLRRLIPFGRRL